MGFGLSCKGLVATWVLLGPSSGSIAEPSGSEIVQDPAATSWVKMQESLQMAGNREYALPLNNPDTVSSEQATHLKETDLVIIQHLWQGPGLSMVDHEQLSCGQRYLQDG